LIDDIAAAISECARILKPTGVLLVTVPTTIRVDDEGGVDGDFWRLTEASARRLFARAFPLHAVEVTTYGNVLACAAFLYGMSAEELGPGELDRRDPTYPLITTVRATKTVDRAAPHIVTSAGAGSPKAAILAYHRIADLTPDSHGLCTPPDVFRDHMRCLKRDFMPMPLAELADAAAAGRIPERAAAVTLDDGYLDALTTASPILMELGIPATFFVNTERLDEEHERWFDMLERVFAGQELDDLNRKAWPMDADDRRALVAEALARAGGQREHRQTHRVLTGSELRELANRPGHTIGGHTTHHLALPTQTDATKRDEVLQNKAALERLLETPVHLFSYPYGDFDAATLAIIREAGYRAAVTVQPKPLSMAVNPLLLPRFEITSRDYLRFLMTMREIFEGRHLCV
jgi:peptidoglycan/xylan/chitin deacetylase (PgdA/CDA1 family)